MLICIKLYYLCKIESGLSEHRFIRGFMQAAYYPKATHIDRGYSVLSCMCVPCMWHFICNCEGKEEHFVLLPLMEFTQERNFMLHQQDVSYSKLGNRSIVLPLCFIVERRCFVSAASSIC